MSTKSPSSSSAERSSLQKDEIVEGCNDSTDTAAVADDAIEDDTAAAQEQQQKPILKYPQYVEVASFLFRQTTPPRSWLLALISWSWFERISISIILVNCVTLGMHQPCNDDVNCMSFRCHVLEVLDHVIFAFFVTEMFVKMFAMGLIGKQAYLDDWWNVLDLFIVIAGSAEYAAQGDDLNLSAIRTIRVLRPLRAINRIPSLRILVILLIDTLPMLGNVFLICFFVFFVFGIVGVQLWSGLLRQRCALALPENLTVWPNISAYYVGAVESTGSSSTTNKPRDFICSQPEDRGMTKCHEVPPFYTDEWGEPCNQTSNSAETCVNWNQFYTTCLPVGDNPYQGAISFDNIGYAWVAIFQVISLEGWADIMYYIQDVHTFWDWIYFVLLIVIGAFFMINLCLVVIATQFSETKRRELRLMLAERLNSQARRSTSGSMSSVFAGDSSTAAEEQSLYAELITIAEQSCNSLWRRVREGSCNVYKLFRESWRRRRRRRQNLRSTTEIPRPQREGDVENVVDGNGTVSSVAVLDAFVSQQRPLRLLLESPQSDVGGMCLPLVMSSNGRRDRYSDLVADCNSSTAAEHDEDSIGQGRLLNHSVTIESVLYEHIKSSPSLAAADDVKPTLKTDNNNVTISVTNADVVSGMRGKLKLYCNRPFRSTVGKFVDTKYFQRGMLVAILINTLSMAIEYHNQPQLLTDVLELFNIFFTILFTFEMLLKLIAVGLFEYIRNGFNVFDSIVVIISLVEVLQGESSGISVLRTFRLLRILKLVRFLPVLRQQLTIMIQTIDIVISFIYLLILFVFIFSILGMHLFGCKFCDGPPPTHYSSNSTTQCSRTNFDSLLWSVVTVFQILTQEGWNEILYTGMTHTSPWAAIYFIFMLMLGNYVIFNILVAILVEAFATGTEPPLETIEINNENIDQLAAAAPSENVAVSDTVPIDQPTTFAADGLAERKRRYSLPDSIEKTACQLLYEKESAMFLSHHSLTLKAVGSTFHSQRQLNTCSATVEEKLQPDEETRMKVGCCTTRALFCCPERTNHTCFVLSPTNRLRTICQWLTSQRWFEYVVLLFIGLNCIALAIERPYIPTNSIERQVLIYSNYVFTVVFTCEMIVKVLADGLLCGTRPYLSTTWNIMDGTLVIISLIDLVVSLVATQNSRIFAILRVFRLLRALRPLRVISHAPGLRIVVETLILSLKPIGNILFVTFIYFVIFGILGVQLFKGSMFYCEGPDVTTVVNRTDCLSRGAQYRWVNRKYNFDNLGQALVSLFVLASKDGWVDVMYTTLDAVGPDQQPKMNHNIWPICYFVSFILLVGFFMLNVFVGIIVDNFHKCHDEQMRTRKRKYDSNDINISLTDADEELNDKEEVLEEYWTQYSKPRLVVYVLSTSKYFDLAVVIIITVNVISMALEHYRMPSEMVFTLKVLNFFFTAVFILEAILKIIACGFLRYFKDRWNCLDLLIALLSLGGIILEEVQSDFVPINPTIVRVMRILRITRVLKLLRVAQTVRAVLYTVLKALPQVGNLALLFFLLSFIFAALGVELFGHIECLPRHKCEGLGKHAHFHDFGTALLTLFRIATGDNWNGILKDTLLDDCNPADDCVRNCCVNPLLTPIFFVGFVLLAQFILINIVVAVLMKHLEDSNAQLLKQSSSDSVKGSCSSLASASPECVVEGVNGTK